MLPADAAAAAIVDLRSSAREYLHVSNPHPTPWNVVMGYVAQKFEIPLVPWAEWLDKLEKLGPPTPENGNTALGLLEFYKAVKVEGSDHQDAGNIPRCDMSVAMSETAALDPEGLSDTGSRDVQKWLDFWGSIGCVSR